MSLNDFARITSVASSSSRRTPPTPRGFGARRIALKACSLLAFAIVAYSIAPAAAKAEQPTTVLVNNTQQDTVLIEWSLTGRPFDWHPLGHVAGGRTAAFQIFVPDSTQFVCIRANYSDETILTEAPDQDGVCPYEF